jgi:hypothetical protein
LGVKREIIVTVRATILPREMGENLSRKFLLITIMIESFALKGQTNDYQLLFSVQF